MRRVLVLSFLAVLLGLLTVTPVRASSVGICASWVPQSSTYCTLATPALDIGSTGQSNPTFNISMNANGAANQVELLILIPESNNLVNPLSFIVTFKEGGSTQTFTMVQSFKSSPFSSGNIDTYLGRAYMNGAKYNETEFTQFSPPGTKGYTVFAATTSLGIQGKNAPGGQKTVSVSFSNFKNGKGFPVGTLIVALGLNSSGVAVYKTPLTLAEEVVPEPASLGLLGLGLFAMAFVFRRRVKSFG